MHALVVVYLLEKIESSPRRPLLHARSHPWQRQLPRNVEEAGSVEVASGVHFHPVPHTPASRTAPTHPSGGREERARLGLPAGSAGGGIKGSVGAFTGAAAAAFTGATGTGDKGNEDELFAPPPGEIFDSEVALGLHRVSKEAPPVRVRVARRRARASAQKPPATTAAAAPARRA